MMPEKYKKISHFQPLRTMTASLQVCTMPTRDDRLRAMAG
jgi:hypothetical protein